QPGEWAGSGRRRWGGVPVDVLPGADPFPGGPARRRAARGEPPYHGSAVQLQVLARREALRVPALNGAIRRRRVDAPPVRREEHVKDSGLVVVVGVARVALAVSSSLPDQDLVVVASGRQPVTFPAEGQSVDASRMPTQR